MSFWDKLLAAKKPDKPLISFGRFTDAYKSKDQLDAWDQSLKLFEEGNPLDSVKRLVDYLRNSASDNIIVEAAEPDLIFLIYHGSKQINCTLDARLFKAESKVAHCKELNVGFLRKAVEYNYNLNYARFALDKENNLCLLFDSVISEASPYKLFYGLRELALQSDKEDDILLDEFENLEPLQNQHIKNLSPKILETKISFIRQKIRSITEPDVLGSLNVQRFQGALTYVYLAAFYGLDYLVKPEGALMELISNLHIQYFATAPANTEAKVSLLELGIKEIQEMSDADLRKELYEVISTFGITSPANQETIGQFIESEIKAINWYEENNHEEICIAICNYIAGYCLYSFAMPAVTRDLFHFYFEIVEANYFKSLGFENNYWHSNLKTLQIEAINTEIEGIFKIHSERFLKLPKAVNFTETRPHVFLKSYLLFIKNLVIS
ncbi:MAG: hypothetical protein WBB02_09245 [Saprospiraceae bacterium]